MNKEPFLQNRGAGHLSQRTGWASLISCLQDTPSLPEGQGEGAGEGRETETEAIRERNSRTALCCFKAGTPALLRRVLCGCSCQHEERSVSSLSSAALPAWEPFLRPQDSWLSRPSPHRALQEVLPFPAPRICTRRAETNCSDQTNTTVTD